jgi:lipopolysaccharide transport system ATP-binding protein
MTTGGDGYLLPRLDRPGRIVLAIDRLDLVAGSYYVDVAAYETAWAYAYDLHWHVYPLQVRGTINTKGVGSAPHRWRLQTDARGPLPSRS